MGLDKLSDAQIKFLQWLVGILLTVLSVSGAWSMQQIYQLKCDLPKEYVMIERYSADQDGTARSLDRIDKKLDRLIESERESYRKQ